MSETEAFYKGERIVLRHLDSTYPKIYEWMCYKPWPLYKIMMWAMDFKRIEKWCRALDRWREKREKKRPVRHMFRHPLWGKFPTEVIVTFD